MQAARLEEVLRGDVEAYLAPRHVADVLADFPAARLGTSEVRGAATPRRHWMCLCCSFNSLDVAMIVHWSMLSKLWTVAQNCCFAKHIAMHHCPTQRKPRRPKPSIVSETTTSL